MDKENMVHTYTIEFYSAIKKNKSMSFAGKQMEHESIVMGNKPNSENQGFYVFFHKLEIREENKTKQNPTKKGLCGGSHENQRETSRTETRDQGREERKRKKYWGMKMTKLCTITMH